MACMTTRLDILLSCLSVALLGACGGGPDAANQGGSGGVVGVYADAGVDRVVTGLPDAATVGGGGGSGGTTVSTGGIGAGGIGGSADGRVQGALDGQADVPIGGTDAADTSSVTIATGGAAGAGGIAETGGTMGQGGNTGTSGATAEGGTTGMGSTVGSGGTTNAGGATGMGGMLPVDANCGWMTSSTLRQPADVLLLLDRSGSMDDSVSTDSTCTGVAGCTARWPALTSAVDVTLTNTADSIHWGLKLFSSPGGDACAVNSGVEVPVSAASAPTIQTQIASVSPNNSTPTAQAIAAATAYLKTVTEQHTKYILLATDGEPNCRPGGRSADANVQGTVDAIVAAKAAGFLVYVIGIGPSVGNLDNFAMAGGTASYFPASSQQDLANAFATIGRAVTTCTFELAQMPPSPGNMAAYLDGNLMTKDDANGWTLGANTQTIVLTGTSCTAMTAGTATEVRVLFGCPGGPPPPLKLP